MSLSNKIALVTGASRGIGKAIMNKLAHQGAYVIGTATSEEGARAITESLAHDNLKGEGRVLNISSLDSIKAFFEAIKDQPGSPAILVNNAGITRDNLMIRMSDEEWDNVIQTNLTSVFHMSKACLKSMMQARFGRIINIGSVVGSMGNAGQVNYCAAKAGVMGFSRALAREVASRNITINTIAPGFIDTDMTAKLAEAQKQALIEAIPMKSMGTPEDIAATVAFLASDGARYITGETIHVNGGMHME